MAYAAWHISQNGVQMLSKKQKIYSLKFTNLEVCTHCLAGKQHRVAFNSFPPSRKGNVLDLLHIGIYSMDAMSLGGARCYITFIDDRSMKVWAYALKSKDQALGSFKLFQASFERETSKKLKCVRSDNDGKYRWPLKEYYGTHGIKFKKIEPEIPQSYREDESHD